MQYLVQVRLAPDAQGVDAQLVLLLITRVAWPLSRNSKPRIEVINLDGVIGAEVFIEVKIIPGPVDTVDQGVSLYVAELIKTATHLASFPWTTDILVYPVEYPAYLPAV